jgi:hypothetical protein
MTLQTFGYLPQAKPFRMPGLNLIAFVMDQVRVAHVQLHWP